MPATLAVLPAAPFGELSSLQINKVIFQFWLGYTSTKSFIKQMSHQGCIGWANGSAAY